MQPSKPLFGSKYIIAREDSLVVMTQAEAVSDATKLAAGAAFGSPDFVVYELVERRRKVCGSTPLGTPTPPTTPPRRPA